MQVQDLLTSGWIILGENSNGEAQLDMITYSVDTMVLKDMLHDSGLPALRGPVKVWVVDNYRDNMIHISTGRRYIPFGRIISKEVTTRT